MKNIAEIDKNFSLKSTINKDGMAFYDIDDKPFKIYGVKKYDGKYLRIPESVANSISQELAHLNTNAAGGRVRFKTNSKKIAIIAKLYNIGTMSHFAFSGSVGFDVYAKKDGEPEESFVGAYIPTTDCPATLQRDIALLDDSLKTITINFPLYTAVESLLIGVEEDSVLEEASDYKISKPVVYYGSSITQGGCASRPGNSYQGFISRYFDCDYINLGFSGNAKGETEIMEYMKNIPMSVFVYDYDYNSPDSEHLKATHERGFKIIREANPEMPVIIMSRPKYILSAEEEKRKNIIRTTYENAVKNGDKNVWFLDGKELMNIAKSTGTVDNCHPTDLGFYSMAQALIGVFKNIFN